MTANKTAYAIRPGTAGPDERFGSAVVEGHPGAGRSAAAGATDGAKWFGQVLKLYGDYSQVTLTRLEWEWESGQCFLLLDDSRDVLGWVSWYRCDFRTLAIIRERDLPSLQSLGPAGEVLTWGEYLYVPTVVSATPVKERPGGPNVLFALLSMVRRLNPDARVIAWHSRTRHNRFQVFKFHKRAGARNGF